MTDHWRDRAACSLADVPLFERAGKAGPEYRHDKADARYKCLRCPVLVDCLNDVMATEGARGTRDREEFRAGLTPAERYARYKNQRKAAQEARTARAARDADALDRAAAAYLARIGNNPPTHYGKP